MENRVFILFCMISVLSFLFVVYSALFLKRRAGTGVIVRGSVWFFLFAAVSVPLFDIYGFINLKLYVNFTGGMRIEGVNMLTDRTIFSDFYIPSNVLNAAMIVCTLLLTARIASSAAHFTYSFSGYLNNLHFLTKHSEECHDDKIKHVFERAVKSAGLKRNISLRVMNKNIRLSPCTCGIIFPSVYIGKEILYDYTEKRLELVFLHELVHIKNHDSALKLFTLLISSLFSGLPCVKMVSEAVYEDAEYRCDAAVIEKAGRSSIGEYMSMIIDVAERNMQNDYRGYDFLSPVSRSGEMILKRYRILKEYDSKFRIPFGTAAVILSAFISNAVLLSSVSVCNIDNVGVDLASPLLEKAVCAYFDIDDPDNITKEHIDSIYCLEFRLSEYNEYLHLQDGYYASAIEINEGLVYDNDIYVSPNPNDPGKKITCDVIEPVIFFDRFQIIVSSDAESAVLLKNNYINIDGVMYLKQSSSDSINTFLGTVSASRVYKEHISAGKTADTRDITLFDGLRTLILSDRIKSFDDRIYISDRYAVIDRSE